MKNDKYRNEKYPNSFWRGFNVLGKTIGLLFFLGGILMAIGIGVSWADQTSRFNLENGTVEKTITVFLPALFSWLGWKLFRSDPV